MTTARPAIVIVLALLFAGCKPREQDKPADFPPRDARRARATRPLAEARAAYATELTHKKSAGEPVEEPPADQFRVVRFPSSVGELAAYLTLDPRDGKKHPAVVWITGGDCNTIGDVWSPREPANDQSAAAFRRLGIAMLFPSLRGGNENPGFREGFYGEVDDVLAAAEFLAKQPFVDPQRIYLGGHSTGGTLVLLAAALPSRFRAVFSFGPVDEVYGYGPEFLPFDISSRIECELRNPVHWLHSVQCPTFVFEGGSEPGNLPALESLAAASDNPLVRCFQVPHTDHFSVLAPTTEQIARKILRDSGGKTNLQFGAADGVRACGRVRLPD